MLQMNPSFILHSRVWRWFIMLVWVASLMGATAAFAQEKGSLLATDAKNQLAAADKAYRLNRFDQALKLYEAVLAKNRLTSPRILMRLSLMEETAGRIPQTLYYLNLLYTLQADEAVRTRMESLARQYQLDGYDMDEWDFFSKLLRRYAVHLFGVFAFMVAMLVGLLWYRRARAIPLRLLPLAIFLSLVVISAALNLNVRYGKAIVVVGKAAFMEDASAASPLYNFIPAGTRLTVLAQDDAWLRVLYKDKQGFVNRSVVWYF